MTSLEPLGDRALLARFGDEQSASQWAGAVRGQGWEGVVDVVLAYSSVAVHADPDRVDLDQLADRLAHITALAGTAEPGRAVTVPVLYDGPDLADVAAHCGLSLAGVVEAHARRDYRVFALGFRPGFPYAGSLPAELQGVPRRASPRTCVPAGSVAIAGRQTAIYPVDSPGGWNLLGRTPLRIVDVEAGVFPIRAGDRLRFVPIGADEFEAQRGTLLSS